MSVSIRQLSENEWRILAAVRLKALRSDPSVFGSNFESESKFTEKDWRIRLQSDDSAIFIIFDDQIPIGMTGVSVFRDDPAKRTAIFWGSWIEPRFRRQGLSNLLYQARIEWAKAHPIIERIIVSHRASNVASKFANQKHGFVFTRTHEKVWTDGKIEDEVCYELKLEA
jgi:RimJ/RimL family protein N-acetyltransferase